MLLALARAAAPQTVRAIGQQVGLSSTSSTQAHLRDLARLGLVRHVNGWELTDTGRLAVANGEPTRLPTDPRRYGREVDR